jgi:hypothetical protein
VRAPPEWNSDPGGGMLRRGEPARSGPHEPAKGAVQRDVVQRIEVGLSSIVDRLRWSQPVVVRRGRRLLTDARIAVRGITADRRADPAFLVIGAQRGGTTSLHRYLAQHPMVVPPQVKEVQFFSSPAFLRGPRWYRAHFPLRASLERRTGGRGATFEASPYYLFHPMAPERIARALPDARFVVLLRDPVERAYSHYRHSVQRGYETLSFEDAIAAEDDRLAGEADRMRTDPTYDSDPYRAFSYFRRGIYADQIAAWEQHVARERLLVLWSESLYADPAATYARVLAFVGLDPWKPPAFDVFERSRPAPGLAAGTRAELAHRYEPHDERLRARLGQDLPWRS